VKFGDFSDTLQRLSAALSAIKRVRAEVHGFEELIV
jgi:hypothetical protein